MGLWSILMGDEVVRLNRAQFDDLKNSAHDIRELQSATLGQIKGQVVPRLDGVAKQLEAINETIRAGFALVAEAIANIQPLPLPQPKHNEVIFMFVVKDDHAPVPFSLALGTVTDAEGNAIPDAQLDVTVESSNPDAVAVEFDAAAKTGSVRFGSPGEAEVRANVSSNGALLGTGAASFTVTVGDPAAISSVDLAFEGLTEA